MSSEQTIDGMMTVAFYAADYERSRRFYEEVLGFERGREWERADATATLFTAGTGQVEIMRLPFDRPASLPQGLVMVVEIAAEAIDTRARDVAARGGKLIWGPMVLPGGKRGFALRDPDGSMITFIGDREVQESASASPVDSGAGR